MDKVKIKLEKYYAQGIELDKETILANNVTFSHEYNPNNTSLYVIGHTYGPVCAVWANFEQDALDVAMDAGFMNCFEVSKEDFEEEESENYAYLGNNGTPCNLDNCWIEKVDLGSQDIELLLLFAEARGKGSDTLDF